MTCCDEIAPFSESDSHCIQKTYVISWCHPMVYIRVQMTYNIHFRVQMNLEIQDV